MTPCPSNCACCQRHTVQVQSLHQRALDELNFYRKLLQLGPLTSMDAFELPSGKAIDNSAPCLGSITRRSAAFQLMPPEILDRILQFVRAESILPLCHALPYYKYISTAMFDFAHRFPNEHYTPSKLWPDMHLSKTTNFPIQHMHAAGVYARIVSKHGGHVHMPGSKDALIYLGILPDVLCVFPGDICTGSGWAEFLRGLADANKQILSCTVGLVEAYDAWTGVAEQLARLPIRSLTWIDELRGNIQHVLPRISGLRYLQVDSLEDLHEGSRLSQCLDLTELAFSRLLCFEIDPDSVVRRILRRIKGSRIRKIWYEISSRASARELKAWEGVTSDFLKHGWHIDGDEDGNGDVKPCFVYRGV
ncbi:hypothetical protein HDU77_011117 [Chytriomyces hyalinus]|nr:hypothetical protein HDU77_011117 [Chytriomyces hyalinus]